MLVQTKIYVQRLGYGGRCSLCNQIDVTTSVVIKYKDQRYERKLCEQCLNKLSENKKACGFSADIQTEPDPEASKQARLRGKRSRALEKKLAETIGGRVQPGSGNTRMSGFKGDIRKADHWRLEHKYTDSFKSYSLKLADLATITGTATDAGEYPAMVIEFRKTGAAFTVMPLPLFLELMDETDNHK